jgi:SAM-dependent MidA family methyltransferase
MPQGEQEPSGARGAASGQPPLTQRLRERVQCEGAISFRDWMEAALYDEQGGYYSRGDLERWGRGGDYRTAPERSPLFSATFASYFAKLYEELGAPPRWTIFEAGAGAGHFAHGVLQTLRRDYPRIFSSTRYVIDEAGAGAREQARARLRGFGGQVEFQSLAERDTAVDHAVVFANELLDALPVHRVKMCGGKLCELFVGLSEEERFVWTEREPSTPRLAEYLSRNGVHLAEGQIAEVSPGVEEWMKRAASVFNRGYLILVDYGAEAADLLTAPERGEGTLRAFRHHRLSIDPLAMPGEQDLTTTIDWTNVKRVAEELGLRPVSFNRQDEFLLRAGILEQLERMTANAQDEAEAVILRSSVRELILPGGMSDHFQTLVLKREEGSGT